MIAIVVKIVTMVAGLVAVAAQAKGRGASTAEAVAETAAAIVAAGGALQMKPLNIGAKQ